MQAQIFEKYAKIVGISSYFYEATYGRLFFFR